MHNRNSAELSSACARRESFPQLRSLLLAAIFVSSHCLGGCAAPGEPVERKPLVPAAVTDLAAQQLGNDVILTFTMPSVNVDRHPLKQTPAIEIYRALAPAPAPPNISPALLVTIPAAIADQYAAGKGQIRYADTLRAADFPSQGPDQAVYMVRTRASAKKDSADSNRVDLRVYPAPDPITDLTARLSPDAIALKWTPPGKTLTGTPALITGYHLFRAETAAPASEPPAAAQVPKLKAPSVQIATVTVAEYADTNFEFGKAYVYTVRSVTKTPDGALESADSNRVTLDAKKIFSPAASQGLVVVLVPAEAGTPAHLELSWSINSETDLAGYNVYRSEQVDSRGARQNTELLRTPAFRDMNAIPGRRYFYSVTAVDRSGNESPASVTVPGGVPADSQ